MDSYSVFSMRNARLVFRILSTSHPIYDNTTKGYKRYINMNCAIHLSRNQQNFHPPPQNRFQANLTCQLSQLLTTKISTNTC